MFRDQYLQEIISNLGIAISPENNSEIIIKNDIFFDKKNNFYVLSDEYKIFYQSYGTIITDFQNTDFANNEQFINFFNKYCLFGLESKKLYSLFKNNTCSIEEYKNFINQTITRYKKLMLQYQNDINSIFNYCLFAPHKLTISLTPFERLCLLEYLPNKSDLLQENTMQITRLNTLSNINSTYYTEKDLIYLLENKNSLAYSNNIYIPNNISSLLHFEITEVLKNNILLKKCDYCNKFFIASSKNAAYCNSIAPGYFTKTCKQVARHKKFMEKQKSDKALALYTKVYNNKAYKASRYKDINDYQIDYKHFKEIGAKKVKAYKSRKISENDFIDWINCNNPKYRNK